jgi:hypothetical protein
VGQFDSPGQFTGTKVGKWELSAKAAGSSITAKALVEIQPGALKKLMVEPALIEVRAGTQVQFNAKGLDAYNNPILSLELVWTLDGGGELDVNTGLLLAQKTGQWIVTATSDSITSSAALTVTPGPLDTFVITPSYCEMNAGETEQFHAEGFDAYGNELDSSDLHIKWQSDDGGAITTSGLYTAQKSGEWQVTAICSDTYALADIEIEPGRQHLKLDIKPGHRDMYVDEQFTFRGRVFDVYGNELTEGVSVDWSVDGGGTFDTGGTFTAKDVGKWVITATVKLDESSLRSTATVTVKPLSDTDTDGDGIPDIWELEYGLDSFDPGDAAKDKDKDGSTNLDEYNAGTDPTSEDSDGDMLPDGWELTHDLNPLSSAGEDGAEGNPDKDSFTNLGEYLAGSDPRDTSDPPKEDKPATGSSSTDEKAGSDTSTIAYALAAIIACIVIIVIFILLKRPKKKEPIV